MTEDKSNLQTFNKNIRSLVLDAGPLITQSASALQQHAQEFYTTPGVHSELKDEAVRQQLILWGDNLKIRHPKSDSIQKVTSFAKLTGDYAVLSVNDLHIIALAYELECEQNNGDWRLRKYPGEVLEYQKKDTIENKGEEDHTENSQSETVTPESDLNSSVAPTKKAEGKKPRRRGGKKQREKREARLQSELESMETEPEPTLGPEHDKEIKVDIVEVTTEATSESKEESLEEQYIEDEDDGEWITPENLQEEMLKDGNQEVHDSKTAKSGPFIKVALATGDFACQNVTMQIGLNLMNYMSGKQIKRVRNYMYRCHACFRLTPIPKSGAPKHFCPKCGGNTLLRCAVSIDNITGKVTPHLKANFQWIKRGEKFSLPSPLSKNQQRLHGNGGFQHNKQNRHKSLQEPLILREDQKEYQQAVKNDDWQRRQNDKILQQWIGGGSADNYISPFTSTQNIRSSGVRVGRGRFVNSSRGKRS